MREWQYIGCDQWIYGEKIRGIVRTRRAEVYFDEEVTSPSGGWRWFVQNSSANGYESTLSKAIGQAEEVLICMGEI